MMCKKMKMTVIMEFSFTIFCLGLCSLLVGGIYEARLEILRELIDIYLSIMSLGIIDKIAMIVGTITLLSFFIFIMSMSILAEKAEYKETK